MPTSFDILESAQAYVIDLLALGNDRPVSAPAAIANRALLYGRDRAGVEGKSSVHLLCEDGTGHVFGDLSGIRTLSPSAVLEVLGQDASTDILRVTGSGGANRFSVTDAGSISGTLSFSGAQTISLPNLGATSTDGLILTNPTAASSGAQQISPRTRWTGQGFATTPAASQTVDWIANLVPVQGAVNPQARLDINYQINGLGYQATPVLSLLNNNVGVGTTIFGASAAGVVSFGGPATAPTTRPASVVTVYPINVAGAGTMGMAWMSEDNGLGILGSRNGFGLQAPSAIVHLAAGIATLAPLKLTAGTNLTTPQAGAIEYDGTNLYFSDGTAVRRTAYATGGVKVAIADGGTGIGSWTNGQVLIGNTTGNTAALATLTGTANQVIVTNGASSITLATPQGIATVSSPTFAGLTVTSNLAVTGTTLGFYGVAAITRPTAYTQTYSLATKTHAAFTSADLVTTASTQTTPWGFSTAAQADAMATQFNALRVDVTNIKQLVNSAINDLKALGLLQ